MRKESKKNIVSKKQNEKNPYRNSQSEAYHKMKEKMQSEKSGVSFNSDNMANSCLKVSIVSCKLLTGKA